jgi:acyl-CoA dehydrogenase
MSAGTGVDTDLLDLFDQVLAVAGPPSAGRIELDRDLWDALDAAGLTRLAGPDAATWLEASALLTAAARRSARVPLAEHELGSWLLERAHIDVPAGIVVPVVLEDGVARAVPWAAASDHLAVLVRRGDGWRAAAAPTAAGVITPGEDLAGSPRDTVELELDDDATVAVDSKLARELGLRLALARSAQITGALEAAVASSVEHATSREQFGRPIARFQAVQNLIADAASEAALAAATTARAVQSLCAGEGLDELELRVAVARSVTGHATSTVVRHAHQVHGAMGTTREHPLHLATDAALAWRSDSSSVESWDRRVAELLRSGSGSLWRDGVRP